MMSLLMSYPLLAQSSPEGVNRPLSEIRDEIKFLPLSLDEKLQVLSHAKILFSKIYVNLEHKKKIYNIDPLAALERIEKNAASMDEESFHGALELLFKSVNDLHANYYFPKPYSCYSTSLAISLQKNSLGTVFVNAVDLSKSSAIKDLDKVELGDELINYNNLPVREALKLRQKHISASTPDAVFYQGVMDLFWQGMYANMLPDNDVIEVTLRKVDGSLYNLSIPWFVSASAKCLNPEKEVPKESAGNRGDVFTQNIKERVNYWSKISKKYSRTLNKKSNLISKLANSNEEKVNVSDLQKTDNSSLTWKVITHKNRNFGYLKLSTFDTEKGIDHTVDQIRSVLVNNLQDTSGLVVDLRGNYGGMISLAEQFAALLTPRPVTPTPFYVRANEMTKLLFNEKEDWSKIILPYADTNKIVGPGFLISKEELRTVSQVYFGKVVLLTNSECFSSCDLFSATMKDNAKVTIYGTDRSTYGGGANVWNLYELKDLFEKRGENYKLPQNISMRITVRHAYRSNKTLIEDNGVASDIVLQETTSDLLDKENSAVLARIYNDLIIGSNLEKSSNIALSLKDSVFIRHENEPLRIEADVKKIDQVAILKEGKVIKRVHGNGDNKISFVLDDVITDYGNSTYEIFGFETRGLSKLPILRKSFTVDNVGSLNHIAKYDVIKDALISNNRLAPDCGWKRVGRTFVITADYCLQLSMGITHSLIMDDQPRKLSFNLKLDTEPDFDYLEIFVVSNGVVETLMARLSTPTDGHFEYDLSRYAGQKIDIKFKFLSDEMFAGKGIELSEMEIK